MTWRISNSMDQGEVIAGQASVASPPDQLGAHQRSAEGGRRLHQLVNRNREFLGEHVIGVASEGGMAERHVR